MPVVTLSPFDPVKTVATMLGSELQGCHFGCAASGGLGDVAAASGTVPAFADELNAKRKAIKAQALSAFNRARSADAKMKAAITEQRRARNEEQKKAAQYKQARAAEEGQKASNDAVVLRARLERMEAAAKVAEQGKMAAHAGQSAKAVQFAADAEAILQTSVKLEVPVVKQPVISAELLRHVPNPAPRVKMALVGNPEVRQAQMIWEQTISPEYLAARNAAWAEVKDIVGAKNPFNQGWTYDDEDWTTYGLAGITDDLTEKSANSTLAVRRAIKGRVGSLGDLGIDLLCEAAKATGAVGEKVCAAVGAGTVVGKQCVKCGFKTKGEVPADSGIVPPPPDPSLPASAPLLPYCDELLAADMAHNTAVQNAFNAWRPSHSNCPLCGEKSGGKSALYNGSAMADLAVAVKGSDGTSCWASWTAAMKAAGVASDALNSCPPAEGTPQMAASGRAKEARCRPRGASDPDTTASYDPSKPGGEGGFKLSTGMVVGGLLGLGVIGYIVSR